MPILAKKNHLFLNKQNCRIWGTENQHRKPTHSKRVCLVRTLRYRGIIGLFFFENEQGDAITANSDCYRALLSEFLFTKIEEEDIDHIWFQQDGATCYTAAATLDVLRPIFFRKADVIWPSRSCELTLAVKDKCYADKPETIDALKDNIREAIGEIHN